MKLRFLCLSVLMTPVVSGVAQQSPPRHTITHEDVFLMKRVSAPVGGQPVLLPGSARVDQALAGFSAALMETSNRGRRL